MHKRLLAPLIILVLLLVAKLFLWPSLFPQSTTPTGNTSPSVNTSSGPPESVKTILPLKLETVSLRQKYTVLIEQNGHATVNLQQIANQPAETKNYTFNENQLSVISELVDVILHNPESSATTQSGSAPTYTVTLLPGDSAKQRIISCYDPLCSGPFRSLKDEIISPLNLRS